MTRHTRAHSRCANAAHPPRTAPARRHPRKFPGCEPCWCPLCAAHRLAGLPLAARRLRDRDRDDAA
jgi:hypothetical protein